MTHLYYKTSTSVQVQETTDAFEGCELVDMDKVNTVEHDEVYLVEIDKTQKDLLLHIKKLLSDKTKSLIYFFINDSHSLMLFQLASLLSVKSIITHKNNTSKVISSIKKELSLYKSAQLEHTIVKNLVNNYYFMIYSSNKLTYASQKIYDDFDCKDLEAIKSKICSQLDLDELLQSDTYSQAVLSNLLDQKTYNIRSNTSSSTNDKFIHIENLPQENVKNISGIEFIKNRIYFIEILKEKILEQSISQSLLGVVTIQIENLSNLKNDWSVYDIEMAIRDLLLQVEIETDSHTLLAQYDSGLYLTLFEGLDFEAIKLQASKIENHISAYTQKQKIKPIIGLYAFDINSMELNSILKIISDISREQISPRDINTQRLHRIININEDLDDERIIDIFLQATYTNKTPIKLLNIYKGLCINTTSTILKKTDQEIYVSYEQLQGTAMHFEQETVMQSSNFSKDIVADVKYVNPKKKFVQLRNFRFVQGSANARKYSRVTCSQRTPISLAHDSGTLNGEILDISMNSIAIRTRVYKNMESLKLSSITLNFTLPITSSEDGYMKLTLEAKVIFVICDEEFCKVVVNLFEDQASESVLMEYVYNRQKEIIVELKKQTNMLK